MVLGMERLLEFRTSNDRNRARQIDSDAARLAQGGNMFLTYAVVSFAIAAVFGVTMAVRVFSGKWPTTPLALLHGVFVIGGFVALVTAAWPNFDGRPSWALAGFAVAAVGGSAMVLGWRAKPLPSALVLIHGGVALIAFGLLASALF
jgi:hypothetical protein